MSKLQELAIALANAEAQVDSLNAEGRALDIRHTDCLKTVCEARRAFTNEVAAIQAAAREEISL